jgi:hypothetical protein
MTQVLERVAPEAPFIVKRVFGHSTRLTVPIWEIQALVLEAAARQGGRGCRGGRVRSGTGA